jgi:hypothetical protein
MTNVQLSGLVIQTFEAETHRPPSPTRAESRLTGKPTQRPFLLNNIDERMEECTQTYLAGARPLLSSEPQFEPDDPEHMKLVDKQLRAALWIRFYLEHIPGPGTSVLQHSLCSIKQDDLTHMEANTSNSTTSDSSSEFMPVTVSGFPLAVTAGDLEARLQEIGVPPDSLSIRMATRKRKYQNLSTSTHANAHLINTAWASMQIPNSVRSWQLLSGFITAFYEAGHGSFNGHMLGFRIEDWEKVKNIIRLNPSSEGPRMTLPSVMNAVGFQQEQWNRFLTNTLRHQGLPALWARMSDCTPRQSDHPTQVYPWFGYHGTIDVFLPSKTVSHNCFYYTSKPECAIPDDN